MCVSGFGAAEPVGRVWCDIVAPGSTVQRRTTRAASRASATVSAVSADRLSLSYVMVARPCTPSPIAFRTDIPTRKSGVHASS
jgi:hypothetical protein